MTAMQWNVEASAQTDPDMPDVTAGQAQEAVLTALLNIGLLPVRVIVTATP